MSRTLELCNLIFQKTVFIWSQSLLLPYLMKLHWDILFETSRERKLVITLLQVKVATLITAWRVNRTLRRVASIT